jgi:hypothetical protein
VIRWGLGGTVAEFIGAGLVLEISLDALPDYSANRR